METFQRWCDSQQLEEAERSRGAANGGGGGGLMELNQSWKSCEELKHDGVRTTAFLTGRNLERDLAG